MFGKYRLLARLASGGMADVFLAASGFAGGASKLLVLKVLRHDLSAEERASYARMFEDEGRLAMLLNHPSIVQSYDVGSEQGQSFIAMEYLEGQPLSSLQERVAAGAAGPISPEMQLHLLCQVLEGLEYAHTLTGYDGRALDIVHRDVSPQNVFVTYAGHAKLVDFGIAKTLSSSSQTASGVVKGKVPYLSPEQAKGGKVDRRADLFSVGVMLWEVVAGRRMHGDASLYEIVSRLVNGELPSLREAAPGAAPELVQIVERALALEPDQRHPSAAALREQLQAFLARGPKLDPQEIGATVARCFARERQAILELIRREMDGEGVAAPAATSARWLAALPLLSARNELVRNDLARNDLARSVPARREQTRVAFGATVPGTAVPETVTPATQATQVSATSRPALLRLLARQLRAGRRGWAAALVALAALAGSGGAWLAQPSDDAGSTAMCCLRGAGAATRLEPPLAYHYPAAGWSLAGDAASPGASSLGASSLGSPGSCAGEVVR